MSVVAVYKLGGVQSRLRELKGDAEAVGEGKGWSAKTDIEGTTAINRSLSAGAPRVSGAPFLLVISRPKPALWSTAGELLEVSEGSVQAISRYAIQSLGVALVVLALKGLAWWITGSVALLSDALESIINVAVAGAAYFALRVSATPPDAKHPFGHHKAEYFSAVLEGALIIVAAIAIFREATIHFFEPTRARRAGLGIAVNVVASAINAVWGWHLIRIGRREKSPALDADGRHVLSDAVSSTGVVVGLTAAVLTGWLQLDAIVAACVGVYILTSGLGAREG